MNSEMKKRIKAREAAKKKAEKASSPLHFFTFPVQANVVSSG